MLHLVVHDQFLRQRFHAFVCQNVYISLPDNVRAEGTVARLFQRTLVYITCVLHTSRALQQPVVNFDNAYKELFYTYTKIFYLHYLSINLYICYGLCLY